jgi:hypothetical protein
MEPASERSEWRAATWAGQRSEMNNPVAMEQSTAGIDATGLPAA